MKPKIEYEVRTVYGVDKFYPRNEAAQIIARIASRMTLSSDNLRDAAKLGFVVSCVPRQCEMRVAA